MNRSQHRRLRVVSPFVAVVGVVVALLAASVAPAAAAVPVGPPALSGGVDGQVYATLVVGNTIYVGGSFSNAQTRAGVSVSRSNLAAFNLNTGALLGSWRADTNGGVRSLASDGSSLYVGGTFGTIGGLAQGDLARVSLATGAVDTGFRPRLNGSVLALQVGGGSVYAGGEFTFSGGVSQHFLAKFNATSGARVAAYTAATNGGVEALSLSPDGHRLAVGGAFTTLSGVTRTGLGLVDPTTGAAVGPAFAASVRPTISLDWSDDGTALFGGSGNSNNVAARWNPTTGARSWRVTAGGDIQAIDFFDGEVYVGFHDNFQGNTHSKLVAVNAQTGAVDPSFRPVFNQFFGVRSISAGPWGLVIGGQFTSLSGVWAHNWARFPAA
jgi:WD40 repeat protein